MSLGGPNKEGESHPRSPVQGLGGGGAAAGSGSGIQTAAVHQALSAKCTAPTVPLRACEADVSLGTEAAAQLCLEAGVRGSSCLRP